MNNVNYALPSSSEMHRLRDSPAHQDDPRKVTTTVELLVSYPHCDWAGREAVPVPCDRCGACPRRSLRKERKVRFAYCPRDLRPSSRACDVRRVIPSFFYPL